MNPQLKVSGIVLTMFDSQTKLSNEVVAELNGFIESAKGKPLPWAAARIFKSKIRRNIKLAESPSFGQTIIKYDPASNGAADYRALAREVISMTMTIASPKPAAPLPVSAPVTPPAPAPVDPPVDRAPVHRAAIERAQVDRAPVHCAPIERAQVDRAPINRAPDRPSVDRAPVPPRAHHASVQSAPVDPAPARKTETAA
jgi:chromosome partitioning protein